MKEAATVFCRYFKGLQKTEKLQGNACGGRSNKQSSSIESQPASISVMCLSLSKADAHYAQHTTEIKAGMKLSCNENI